MNSADYDKETIEKAEAAAKSYLKNNYEDIKSIEIEKTFKGPLGGLNVEGTVNEKYFFNLDVEQPDFNIGSIGVRKGFPKKKAECKEKDCDY